MQRQCQLGKSRGQILAAEFADTLRTQQARPEDLEGNGFNFISGVAGRTESSNQAACAGTGDEIRLETVAFQSSYDSDVRQPAKATSAEGQTKGISAPAFCRGVHKNLSRGP